MKEFEYWKNEILKIAETGRLALRDNKPVRCGSLSCTECGFFRNNECYESRKIKWLYAEHVERSTLTKKERMLCELIETGWIARDKNGKIYWYTNKPERRVDKWMIQEGSIDNLIRFGCSFDFIHWEDCQPWSVEDLLKLDVRD